MAVVRGALPSLPRLSVRAFGVLALLAGLVAACAPSIDQRDAVHVLTYDGTVDPVMERYIDRGIDEAENTDARAVVIRLDTPGGLVSSMEDIVKRIVSSEVPVIVYVWPSGGHAASAGTPITYAAHIAAMAPGTRIGAASVVGSGGQDLDETLSRKATNDLVALITGLAKERGRNADWAEDAVRFAVAADSKEAVELNVVNFEARSLDGVIEEANGRTVRVGEENREVTLDLLDAPVVENNRTFIERFLGIIADPNIAFLLLSLGALALVFEFVVPGHIFPGVFGAISLLLAFFALGTLPVNWAGVALILLAFVLFGLEAYIAGFGALGIGGIVALILGGLLLTTSGDPEFQVNRWLVVGLPIVLGALFLSAVGALIRTRRAPPYMGSQSLVGRLAVARSDLSPQGVVFMEGARWQATAEGEPVVQGERVEITAVKGLKLTVRKAKEAPVEGPSDESREGEGSIEG
jgi:membrane-bound serine protease (ClpP class)